MQRWPHLQVKIIDMIIIKLIIYTFEFILTIALVFPGPSKKASEMRIILHLDTSA